MNFGDLRFVMDEIFFATEREPKEYDRYVGPDAILLDEGDLWFPIFDFYKRNRKLDNETELPKKWGFAVREVIMRSGHRERLHGRTRKKIIKNRRRYMYSLTPRKRIGTTEVEVEKFMRFVKKLSNCDFYKEFWFSIESGKHMGKPNLHVHIVLEFKNSGNFADRLHKYFENEFPGNTLKYKIKKKNGDINEGVNIKKILNDEIWIEKMNYLNNLKKNEFGEDHTNYIDLSVQYPGCKNWT